MTIRKLRIHGDNIIECERGLLLIGRAFSASVVRKNSPPYMPLYEIQEGREIIFTVELLPGHGRWGVNLQDVFRSYGAPLRESVDALITLILEERGQEEVLLAAEFSSALPAGNNAWQRNGRALGCATIGIPYLYFTEVGGVELGEDRVVKAPRFPNPIVPFSYLTATKSYGVLCLPSYVVSPSASKDIQALFQEITGEEDALKVVRTIIERNTSEITVSKLSEKTLQLIQILANQRKRVDTLRGDEWKTFLNFKTGPDKAQWLEINEKKWRRKKGSKVSTTSTFVQLEGIIFKLSPVSIGANEFPICLIPGKKRQTLANQVSNLYGEILDSRFVEWLAVEKPLLGIWITGFKPRGDDSRPDRGLVPFARMLFGEEVHILTIVSGPAKSAMWQLLKENPAQLAKQNGLWEAIINLSNAVLADSLTLEPHPLALLQDSLRLRSNGPVKFSMAGPVTSFSEHDVDTIIHLLFSNDLEKGVFEAMCNPPGGDWSGLSIFDFKRGDEYRWTSLPRVSTIGGKRPDHVIQFEPDNGKLTLLAIESKDSPLKLPINLGRNLTKYMRELLNSPPIAVRKPQLGWSLWVGEKPAIQEIQILSGGAFCWQQNCNLENYLQVGEFDIVLAVEFDSIKQWVLLHIKTNSRAVFLLDFIRNLAQRFDGRIEIQVH